MYTLSVAFLNGTSRYTRKRIARSQLFVYPVTVYTVSTKLVYTGRPNPTTPSNTKQLRTSKMVMEATWFLLRCRGGPCLSARGMAIRQVLVVVVAVVGSKKHWGRSGSGVVVVSVKTGQLVCHCIKAAKYG